jgi:hypothetical protein
MTQTDFGVLGFFAADHAAAADGKLYVNGGYWNKLQFPAYPATLPVMAIAAVLLVPFRAYHQDHRFRLGMVDSDETDMGLSVEGSFRVGADPDMRVGDPTMIPLAIPISGLGLPKPGDYSFTLSLDGSEVARYTVRAVQIAQIPPGFSPGESAPTPPDSEDS